jgi:hypothetical protein
VPALRGIDAWGHEPLGRDRVRRSRRIPARQLRWKSSGFRRVDPARRRVGRDDAVAARVAPRGPAAVRGRSGPTSAWKSSRTPKTSSSCCAVTSGRRTGASSRCWMSCSGLQARWRTMRDRGQAGPPDRSASPLAVRRERPGTRR